MKFDYYYGMESGQFAFFRIPRLLVKDSRFSGLSNNAKLLYGLMLDRMALSLKNGWIDAENHAYIYYSLDTAAEDLGCARSTCVRIMAELDNRKGIGLIERVRQGQGKPDRIYVKNFASFEDSPKTGPDEEQKAGNFMGGVDNAEKPDSASASDHGRGNSLKKAVNMSGIASDRDASNAPSGEKNEATHGHSLEKKTAMETCREKKGMGNRGAADSPPRVSSNTERRKENGVSRSSKMGILELSDTEMMPGQRAEGLKGEIQSSQNEKTGSSRMGIPEVPDPAPNYTEYNKTEYNKTLFIKTEKDLIHPIYPINPIHALEDRDVLAGSCHAEDLKAAYGPVNVMPLERASPHECLRRIGKNIEYDHFIKCRPRNEAELVRTLFQIISEVLYSAGGIIKVSGVDYPVEMVRYKFLKLNSFHIEYIIECVKGRTIRNVHAYMLAVLFNAVTTMDFDYQQQAELELNGACA